MVTHILIEDDTYRTSDEGDYSSEPYSPRPDTYTSHNFTGFKIVGKNSYFDLALDFTPEPDKDYFLLYAIHGSGDSFGSDYGSSVEYYGLYTREQLDIAKTNMERLQKVKKEYNIKLLGTDGKEFQAYTPWAGYFDNLDEIDIKKIRLEEEF